MLVIRAQHKQTGTIYEFTPGQWYEENKTGNYNYISTVHKEQVSAPLLKKTTTVKRGCGCKK
jgi:hypothetical protein